jgi:uncharacterized protein YaeQ
MALGATMFRFVVDVSDVDRQVYTTDEFAMARHPSETDASMITRVLAWALEFADGIQFGRGVAFPDEPALQIPDDRGGILRWIEVGAPAAARVHKAAKSAATVAIYSHRPPDIVYGGLRGERIHHPEHIDILLFPQTFMTALEQALERRNTWSITRNEGVVYVTVGDRTIECTPLITTLDRI